ncbi:MULTISPECIES: IclR family transcriptional regulator [unclassified Bradyrhizobium]|uniref:IclR family transcriptional regulator n=1 Tax=unclassified Bradyrhizobium TaxID=2631580 RepID=UPI0009E4D547|nr:MULTISPECIES: IclR family transcriptional regulator [unclassified Bradyrhizobium]
MKRPARTPSSASKAKKVPSGPTYSAPALEKGLDILEMLCRSNIPLSQSEIAESLGRSVSEIYRMLTCLVDRNYIVNIADTYAITTKVFELAHSNPPTNRLLAEAGPLMQELSSSLQQACHLTVYNQGRQIVIAKVDNPAGMGFSLRVGAELDVLVSASGRALLAFQDPETIALRVKESVQRRPEHASLDITPILDKIRKRGFESIVSLQIKGLHAVGYPILDTQNRAIAALTVPYAERLDQSNKKTVSDVEAVLGKAARALSERMGWRHGETPGMRNEVGEAATVSGQTPARRVNRR